MQIFMPNSLKQLAEKCNKQLYIVGGTVRDALAGFAPSYDFDLAAPLLAEDFCCIAEKCNLQIKGIYKHTGTVQFTDGRYLFEYTTFRQDSYRHGEHTPIAVQFINDLATDALRRDFKCNAIYYNIANEEIVDPLDAQKDIAAKLLTTTRDATTVFAEDGLRLMRLARFAATLGFEADLATIFAAKFNAAYIQNIAPERIFTELNAILHADTKHNIPQAHYIGLKILEATDIFHYILPELALGAGMTQRADFHKYDVLEHSLQTCKYAHASIRFAALLHDIGKPTQRINTGKFSGHDSVGAELATAILSRLKAPKALLVECSTLTAMHMFDLQGDLPEETVRKFFVQNYPFLHKLFYLRQADFSAGKDTPLPCPTVVKWQNILHKMQQEGVPFSVQELKINGNDIKPMVKKNTDIGKILKALLEYCSLNGQYNTTKVLLQQAMLFAQNI